MGKSKRSSVWVLALVGGLCLGGGGCSQRREFSADPAALSNSRLGPMTIAVAPALNFSGSADFDANSVADLMASELGYVNGITVIPVSRVLAAMARLEIREVGSPAQALAIREQLGCDVVLVFAVTEYDPYDPPVVGLAAQLHGQLPDRGGQGGIDPVLVSRQSSPSPGEQSGGGPGTPLGQAQAVYNAAHDYVVQQVKRFADYRGDDGSAFGWRLYLVSQEHYLRFCCHSMIKELFGRPKGTMPEDAEQLTADSR